MSDESTGFAPDEGAAVSDPGLDAIMARWVANTGEPIDVEAALQRVNARRRADESSQQSDDLARRRTAAAARATPFWQRESFRAAAAVVAVLGAAALWRATRTTPTASYVTAIGVSRDIRLADGTAVRLGPASSIQLDAGFGDGHRRLTLHGEAWFNVTHDERKPFAIRVGATTVEDGGTAFQVRESPDREVSVRVAEGAVRLTRSAGRDSTVMLQAGDGAVASATGIVVSSGSVTTQEREALAAGRLTFTDASLVEVHDALERWYGVNLIVADSALARRHVTADFTGEPMSRVASVLGLTLGVNAELHGDTIELLRATGVPARP